MIVFLRWAVRRLLASQSAKRAWVARAVTAWAIVRWLLRRFSARDSVRVGRTDDVIVTVVPRGGGSTP